MKRPRIATVVALAFVVGAFAALIGISLASAIVYYVTPTELANAGDGNGSVRLYGIVEPGSVRWDSGSSTLSFRITDGTTTMSVRSEALPTGLFRDGIGVVLSGRLTSPGDFEAAEILIKHSAVYEPLKPGETPPPNLLDSLRAEAP